MKKPKYYAQSVFVDICKKNCENCTQEIYEKVFRDLGSGFIATILSIK